MKFERAAGKPNETFYVTGNSDTTGNVGVRHTVYHKRHAVSHRKVWTCDCGDFTHRRFFKGEHCKHILYAIAMIAMEKAEIVTTPTPQQGAPANPTAKAILKGLIEFLNYGPREESENLWDIITVLRGPDKNDSYALKGETTAVFRRIVGMVKHGSVSQLATVASADTVLLCISLLGRGSEDKIADTVRAVYPECDYHFCVHYARGLVALRALGLI